MKLTIEDAEDLDFALTCFTWDAISVEEFKEWIGYVISIEDDYPLFLLDLLEFEEDSRVTFIRDVVGFEPFWEVSENKLDSLYGIAYKRGRKPFECPLSCEEARGVLLENEDVLVKFKESFPFIEM